MSRTCTVAIDFGTAYSGYAYILTANNQEVQRVKRWQRRAGADTAKTPTCVLFDQNGDFMEFGYKARDKYYKISKNPNTFYYFRGFKLELYNQRNPKDLVIKDVNKKPMSAMKVFSAALRFLKEDALKTMDKETQKVSSTLDFTWVLTVPAIWDIPARRFMREAAVQAGIDPSSHKLEIALESEAASVWCRQLSAEDFLSDTDVIQDVTMSPGTQYVVVDCGGGTMDVTAHEVLKGGDLKELHKASGNGKGGWTVEKQFTRCLRQFFCAGLWEEYERDHPKEVQHFIEDFSTFRQTDHSHVRQLNFGERFRDMIEKRKKKRKYPLFTIMDGLTFYQKPYSAKLEISEQRMESFFHETLDNITDRLSEALQEHRSIRYILLVGGLSSSHMIRERVCRQFSHRAKVLCPKNPQEAIVKGAVLFGRDQSVIRSRKSAFTYGFSKIMPFDPSKHKAEKKIVIDDGVWCRHLFRKMVEVNEDVGWDETREFSIYPLEGDQRKMSFDFYRTKKKDPMYIDESEVEGPVASCDVILPRVTKEADHEVKLKIYFGSTTITAEATDVQTLSTVSVFMDFKSPPPVFLPTPPPFSAPPRYSGSNRSSSIFSLQNTATPTSSRTPVQRSFKRRDVERLSSTKRPPAPSDQSTPTATSSRSPVRQNSKPGDGAPPSTHTRQPVTADLPAPEHSSPPVRQKSRPGEVQSSATATHPPVTSKTVIPSSAHLSQQQRSRPGEIQSSITATHPPVASETQILSHSRLSQQQRSRKDEIQSSTTATRPPVTSETLTPSSARLSQRRRSRPGEIQSHSATRPPVAADQPAPTSSRRPKRQSSRPSQMDSSYTIV